LSWTFDAAAATTLGRPEPEPPPLDEPGVDEALPSATEDAPEVTEVSEATSAEPDGDAEASAHPLDALFRSDPDSNTESAASDGISAEGTTTKRRWFRRNKPA
jgi:hypothetical protein